MAAKGKKKASEPKYPRPPKIGASPEQVRKYAERVKAVDAKKAEIEKKKREQIAADKKLQSIVSDVKKKGGKFQTKKKN